MELNETTKQLQTNSSEKKLFEMSKVNESAEEESEIGKESQSNSIQSKNPEIYADADIDQKIINRRIHYLEDFQNIDEIEENN